MRPFEDNKNTKCWLYKTIKEKIALEYPDYIYFRLYKIDLEFKKESSFVNVLYNIFISRD